MIMALTLMMKKNYKPFYLLLEAGLICLTSFTAIADESSHSLAVVSAPSSDEYIFDPALFKGATLGQTVLEQLSQENAILPGEYKLNVYVNQIFLGNYLIDYKSNDGVISPCLSRTLVNDIHFKEGETFLKNNTADCFFLEQITSHASLYNQIPALKLTLIIPQAELINRPRGYVNPEDYETGANIGFVNYIGNYYHVSYDDEKIKSTDSAWVSLNGGVNLGDWQYRQMSNMTWSKENGNAWKNIRSYVQRPLVPIGSQFMAGQLVTNGQFFSGMSYNGLNLATSKAMLPESQRGYAPIIQGVANTNARVVVSQNNQEIYQITVPPGAFEINDLYPTSYNGDLLVQIFEADGTTKTFTVPYSSLPESIRPGMSFYNFTIGQTRNTQDLTYFSDFIYQRGLSNAITANSGLRVAKNYTSAVFGGVYASPIGAIGVDFTFSRAKEQDHSTSKGWMTHISWSKTFSATGTGVSLASYRYSTEGYRDLSSILNQNKTQDLDYNWMNYTISQKERFDVTLNQSLKDYGYLYLSFSRQVYRDGRSPDNRYQLTYSKSFRNGINMNLSLAKQYISDYAGGHKTETTTSISFSIPFQSSMINSLTASYYHNSNGGEQYQSSLSGTIDDDNQFNYGVNVSRDNEYKTTVIGGNMQARFSKVSLGVNTSKSNDYWQASGNAQGALAIHSGGITFGPYLGETFALVEAKGAEGATLFTSSQTRIDSNGYALISSVTPYRYNNISINPQGMEGNAEIVDSQKRILPVAGSSSKVTFKTKIGTAILITATTQDGDLIPMGAQVYDEKNEVIGIVGQGGQVYARVERSTGQLKIKLSNGEKECFLPYHLSELDLKKYIVNLSEACQTQ